MATPAPLDADRIVRTLHTHGVDCVVVGGVGANLYGAKRVTEDLDLVARYDVENLRRLVGAMRELGAYVRTDGYVDDATLEVSKHLVHVDHLARTEITTWHSDAGPFDVLRNIPDADGARRDYDELVARSSEVVHGGVIVRIASLDDIVASKRWANRPKDQQALPELYRLQGRDDARPEPGGSSAGSGPRRGPGVPRLANGLDHPGGATRRPPESGVER